MKLSIEGESAEHYASRARPSLNAGALIAVQVAILVVLLLFSVALSFVQVQGDDLINVVSWGILLISLWSFWSWKQVSNTLFDPYTLFLFAAIVFNGGQAFLQLFGFNEDGILGGQFSSETIVTVLVIVAVGLAALHCGALISAIVNRKPSSQHQHVALNLKNVIPLRLVGLLLIAVSAIPSFILISQAVSVVVQGGYFALYQQEAATGTMAGPRVLAAFLTPGCLFLLAGSRGSRAYIVISAVLILAQSTTTLVLGARYAAVAPLVAYAWVWHRCVKPLPMKLLLATGAILIVVVFPTLRVIRNVALEERTSLDAMLAAYTSIENPVISTIAELGGTLKTVVYTFELVPAIRPYDYGVQYLYSALTILPNVFWDVHPTIAHGTPAAWVVETAEPLIAATGGGLGYSFIAEAFLNFGFWGVPILLFVMGLVYARIVIWGSWSSDPARIATVGAYLSFFMVYARADSTAIVRPLIWYSLMPYLLIILIRRLQKV